MNLEKRHQALCHILANVQITPGGCWLWLGSTSGNGRGGGYGRISYLGQTWAVHLLAFFAFFGRWPKPNKHRDHKCEIRLCCNPMHLEEVTQSVNEKRKRRRRNKVGD